MNINGSTFHTTQYLKATALKSSSLDELQAAVKPNPSTLDSSKNVTLGNPQSAEFQERINEAMAKGRIQMMNPTAGRLMSQEEVQAKTQAAGVAKAVAAADEFKEFSGKI